MRIGHSSGLVTYLAVGLVSLGGCAAFPTLRTGTSLGRPEAARNDSAPLAGATAQGADYSADFIQIPDRKPSPPPKPDAEKDSGGLEALLGDGAKISVSLPPQALPQFLDTALGEILKLPYALGPNIGSRQEIVTLRSSPDMSRAQFFNLLKAAMKDYGVRLTVRDGAVIALDEPGTDAAAAIVLRSRSAKDTPESARTVTQFFQLQALEANSVEQMVRETFPAAKSVNLRVEQFSNTLILSGSGRDVQSLVSFLEQLDRPLFSGSTVLRLRPEFWSTDAFAKALEDTLTIEGYKVSRSAMVPRSIIILAMPSSGQVLVFVNDPALLERVQTWAHDLDQPGRIGDQKSSFVYEVRNTSAAELGSIALGNSSGSISVASAPVGVAGGAPASSSIASTGRTVGGALPSGGTLSVDAAGNRILFTGSGEQYAVLRSLLEQLDRPPPQVMIEVTIAEVTLTDSTRLGLEWFFNQKAMGGTFSGGTESRLGLGGSGMLALYARKDLRAAFNAFASNNKVNIISRPRLTTKSGESARIQVGTDIPIITSQAASNLQLSSGTQVLQTVQYRQTGVNLGIKPTVYGNNRIDLEISQEISKQAGAITGSIASPSILNRSLSTKVSLVDGATHVMGGLMDDNFSKSNQGIPILKDLPLVGNAFRTDTLDGTKTELVLLVTPFILRDADDMAELADQMSGEINRALKVGRGGSYTLTGISTGLNLGLNLPSARPPVAGLGRQTSPIKKGKKSLGAASPAVRP